MRPSVRGNSKTGKKIPPSVLLEQEAQQMEEKLKALKRQMAGEKEKREEQQMRNSSSRWATSSAAKPLKNYSKNIIKEKNDFIKKTGAKLGGTANFSRNSLQNSKSNLSNTVQLKPPARPSSGNKSLKCNNLIKRPQSGQKNKGKENQMVVDQGVISGNLGTDLENNSEIFEKEQKKAAESNLMKHIEQQKQIEPDHIGFLKEINLIQYTEKFGDNGFDDLDAIIELNTELLNDMMIPAGHQIKIMKRVDKIRKEKGLDLQQENILEQYSQKNAQAKRNQVKKRTDLVELDYEEPQQQTHSIAIGDDAPQPKKASAFDGEFDERESHNSFLEALMEFRGQKPEQSTTTTQQSSEQEQPKKRKSVKFTDEVVDNEGKSAYKKGGPKKTFGTSYEMPTIPEDGSQKVQKQEEPKKAGGLFFMGGTKEYNNEDYKPVTNVDSDMQTVNKEIPVGDKIGCWQCLKLFLIKQQIQFSGKSFCSQDCYQKFNDVQQTKCQNPKCRKELMKSESIFKNGQYYCTEKCAPSLEEIVLEMRQSQQFDKKQENKNQEDLSASFLKAEDILELEQSFVQKKTGQRRQQKQQQQTQSNRVLSLAQLEQKYSSQQNDVLEDSLELK